MTEIVYIMTNPTIPDLVKIGQTSDITQRLRDLSRHPGIPVPFECYYCCEVKDAKEVESALHRAFGDHRINPKREFFRISPDRIKAILEISALKDMTPGEDNDIVETKEERDSLARERSRSPVFTFSMVDIPIGSKLRFSKDDSKIAKVTGEREIEFEGEIEFEDGRSSMQKITLYLLKEVTGKEWTSVRPSDFWKLESDDETLTERRVRMEGGG
ncbi:MAG: GIY-YIG nuclease family protein [Pseudomonadales bacterium]